jgi:hypothetical protein
LLAIRKAANDAIDAAWIKYVHAHDAIGSKDVLDALAKLPQFQMSVARILRCRRSIEELVHQTPTDPQRTIDRLRALKEEHRAAWSELDADGIPSVVILFLRACADRGAPLSELSDEVHKWLESRRLLGSFRVRIG